MQIMQDTFTRRWSVIFRSNPFRFLTKSSVRLAGKFVFVETLPAFEHFGELIDEGKTRCFDSVYADFCRVNAIAADSNHGEEEVGASNLSNFFSGTLTRPAQKKIEKKISLL